MATPGTPSSAAVSDVYSELLILGGYLKDARDLGNPDTLRARLEQMFQAAERRGVETGIPHDTLTAARYAVTAFLDEMILNSAWSYKDQWSSKPLVFQFFGSYVAGVEFFTRLDTIRKEWPVNIGLLEVFAHCLILGFEGQYRLEGREKLKGLTDDVVREIQAKRGEKTLLSPHAKRPEELLEVMKRDVPIWVIVVSSLGLVFFFHLALSLIINHDANNAAQVLLKVKP